MATTRGMKCCLICRPARGCHGGVRWMKAAGRGNCQRPTRLAQTSATRPRTSTSHTLSASLSRPRQTPNRRQNTPCILTVSLRIPSTAPERPDRRIGCPPAKRCFDLQPVEDADRLRYSTQPTDRAHTQGRGASSSRVILCPAHRRNLGREQAPVVPQVVCRPTSPDRACSAV